MSVPLLAILDIDSVYWRFVEGQPSDENALALTDFETNIVTVKPGLPDDRFVVTVWHEIVHIILGQRLGQSSLMSGELEEAVCAAISHGLFGVLERNLSRLTLETIAGWR